MTHTKEFVSEAALASLPLIKRLAWATNWASQWHGHEVKNLLKGIIYRYRQRPE